MRLKTVRNLIVAAAVVTGAFYVGKFKGMLQHTNIIVVTMPNNFYVFGKIPTDGSHGEDVEALGGFLDAFLDEKIEYEQMQQLNDMYYSDRKED